MKIKLTIIALVASVATAMAQGGTIDNELIEKIKESYATQSSTKAVRSAIQSNASLKALALDASVANAIDHKFKYSASAGNPISDQHSSGRCWMFTSMNVLRPQTREVFNVSNFEFSHAYNYFWDIFEKSNLFLETMIRTADKEMDDREVVHHLSSPIDDGGVWNHFYNLSIKYGVVPKEVMPETIHSNNTQAMLSVIKERLRKGGIEIRDAASSKNSAEQMAQIKFDALSDIYRILSLCLGTPPSEFDWRYTDSQGADHTLEGCTPLEFFEMIAPEDYSPDTYIMVMNDPTRPYYKVYDIDQYRNTAEGTNWRYLNLPNEQIKAAALASIKAGESMYISCDVGKELNSKAGVMGVGMYDLEALLGIDLTMDKRSRILSRHSGSSHAMTLMACDTDAEDRPLKWQVENSWGANSGHNGYLTFTDEWFSEYIFRVVLRSSYLDAKSLKALEGKVISLPAWDYMF